MGKEPNVFASSGIDRLFRRRHDVAWLEKLAQRGKTHVVPVWHSMNLVRRQSRTEAVLPSLSECASLLETCRCVVLLGEFEGHTYIALELADSEQVSEAGLSGEFLDLHGIGSQMESWQGALLAYARGILHWHSRNQHCGLCGSTTSSVEAGHMRICTNEACVAQHFPRTDPAIIVLVTDRERCLLGRQAHWEARKYSTIAGFVEPGESLEDAVRREVLEETGVQVGDVYYHSSQPWPFPSSIMIGFTALADTHVITVDKTELEEARWLTRQELQAGIASGEVILPSEVSIANRLIRDWMAQKRERE